MNASSAVVENGSVQGDGVSVLVPSRFSLAALCSPSGSPLPTTSKADATKAPKSTAAKQDGGRKSEAIRESDLSDQDVRMEDAPSSQTGKKQGLEGGAVYDKSDSVTDTEPADRMKVDGEDDGGGEEGSDDDEEGNDDDDEEEGEGEDEGEDEDEDEEEEEEDDDDDDDDEDGSASESGTFRSASEVEGEHRPEVEQSSSTAKESEEGQNVTHLTANAVASTSTNGSIMNVNGATKSTSADSNEKAEAPSKKKKPKRRSPSVDLALPVGPPARPTMRLQLTIAHDDEEPYMTNVPDEIYKKLKAKGHAWANWYASTLPEEAEDAEMSTAGPSNGVDLRELGGLAKLLQKYPDKPAGSAATAGGRKRRKFDEYDIGQYDVRDPFVDDSELGVDEPTHAAKPQADGFFVTQGEVELEKAVAAAQDLMTSSQAYFGASGGKRAPIPPGFGESVDGGGGAGAVSLQLGAKPDNVVIANVLLAQNAVSLGILSPAEEGDESRQSYFEASRPSSPVKRQASDLQPSTLEGSRQSPIKLDDDTESKPKPIFPGPVAKYPTRPIPKRLEREFDMLRQKVAKESWLKKTKFPPDLRDPLMQASKVAIGLGEYNDNFFNWLPHIFPYNKLTLHKYTKRQFLNKHTDYMRVLIEKNLEVLEKQVTETLPVLQREFDEAKTKWTSGGGVSNGTGAEEEQRERDGTDQQNDADVDNDDGDKEDDVVSKGGEPVKRWRWSEANREVLFTIVTLDNAIMELKTEKTELENSSEKNSMTNARKLIYKRIFDAWPEDGWTTTTHISREYALYKRKVDRYTVQYHETQGRDIDSAIAV